MKGLQRISIPELLQSPCNFELAYEAKERRKGEIREVNKHESGKCFERWKGLFLFYFVFKMREGDERSLALPPRPHDGLELAVVAVTVRTARAPSCALTTVLPFPASFSDIQFIDPALV